MPACEGECGVCSDLTGLDAFLRRILDTVAVSHGMGMGEASFVALAAPFIGGAVLNGCGRASWKYKL